MDYNITPRRLTIALVLFAALIVLGLITFSKPDVQYTEPAEEALQSMFSDSAEIGLQAALQYAATKDPGFVFIDLRNPYEFAKGHLEGAVNIPALEILSKANLKLIRKFAENNRNIVIYANDQSSANGTRYLLTQIGIDNVYSMRGGYQESGKLRDSLHTDSINREFRELAWYDYPSLIQSKKDPESGKADIKAPKEVQLKPKPAAPKADKPAQQEPQGC